MKTNQPQCKDDSCDLSHCVSCGSHMLGGYVGASQCEQCAEEERQRPFDHLEVMNKAIRSANDRADRQRLPL